MFDLIKLLNVIKNNTSAELDLANEKIIDLSIAQQSSYSFPDEREQGVHLQLVQLSETHLLTTHAKYARVWNLDSNETVIIKSPSSKHGIINVRRLANNRILFNQSDSADIYIYDWKEQKLICKISPEGLCTVLENGNLVSVGGLDESGRTAINIWDIEQGKILKTFYEKIINRTPSTTNSIISLDNDKIAFIINYALYVWDIKNGHRINLTNDVCTNLVISKWIRPLVKLPSGKCILMSYKQDGIDIWDVESNNRVQTFKIPEQLWNFLICNGNQFFTAYKSGHMQVWDLQTGKSIQLLKNAHNSYIRSLTQFSNNFMLSVPQDGNVKIWDTRNWQCLKVLGGYYTTPSISCVEISDNKLAILYYDQLRVWEFGYRHLQLQDIIELLKALKDNQTITMLNLAGIILGNQGVIEIADLIIHNQTIITIDLQNTHITDEGAKTLLNAIQHNHVLKVLKLNGNSISTNLLEQIHQHFGQQNVPSPVQNVAVNSDTPKDQQPKDQPGETQLPSGATVKNSSAKEKIKVFNVGNSSAKAHVDNTKAQNITTVSLKQTIPARNNNSNNATSSASIPRPLSSPPAPSASVSHTKVGGNLNVTSKVKNIQPVATVSNAQVTGNVTVTSHIHYEQKSSPSPKEKRIASQQQLEDDLRKLRDRQLKNEEVQQELAVYVPIQGSNNFEDNELFDIATKVKAFLASRKKVLLLLGDSGMGKSLFGRALEKELWEDYDNGKPIPLFISLPSLRDPIKNAIDEHLSQLGFKLQQIAQLKKDYSFIFIFDGYDEIAKHKPNNLYRSNKLFDWNAKVTINCRSQYLLAKREVYLDRFLPDYKDQPEPGLFQEILLKPFTQEQINIYLQKFIEVEKPVWQDWQIYRKYIETIPGLKGLIETPFILRIAVEVLPVIAERSNDEDSTLLTRVDLYDAFAQRWFRRQASKLDIDPEERDIKREFKDFSERLAKKMLQLGINEVVIETHAKNRSSEWDEFFGNDPDLRLKRSGCPLKKLGDNRFAFIHESLLEYFGARDKFAQSMTPKISAKWVLREFPFPQDIFPEPVVEKVLAESLPLKQSQPSLKQEPDKKQQQQRFNFWQSSDAKIHTEQLQPGEKFYQDGMKYFMRSQYLKALSCFEAAAQQSYPAAYLRLGWLYLEGGRVGPKDIKSQQWYQKAAQSFDWFKAQAGTGGAAAQYDLGCCYYYGKGVNQDYAEAVRWFQKAADQGYAIAQYDLGYCYYYAQGVNQNFEETTKWYLKAADQRYAPAQRSLGFSYEHGIGAKQNDAEAIKWYQEAADQGYAEAQYNLGVCYEHCHGVREDLTEAVKWYRKAANQGLPIAQYMMGFSYQNGRGVKHDFTEAAKWYQEAANQELKEAKDKLEQYSYLKNLLSNPSSSSLKFY